MTESKRRLVWNGYFEAGVRSRYFIALKDQLQRQLTAYTLAIALLSSGPLANFLFQFKGGDLLSGLTGLLAGGIGIYVASGDRISNLALAKQAAIAWTRHSARLSDLWARCEDGEDVYDEFVRLDRGIEYVDALVIDKLSGNGELIAEAYRQTTASLCPSV